MHTRLTRSGERTCLQIVEGFRAEGKVRQRVVANPKATYTKPAQVDT